MRLRPLQIWAPDTKSTPFKRKAHRQVLCLITTDPAEERRPARHEKGVRLQWKVWQHGDGARVIEPGRAMGKAGALAQPGPHAMALANGPKAFAKSDRGGEIRCQHVAPSGSMLSASATGFTP